MHSQIPRQNLGSQHEKNCDEEPTPSAFFEVSRHPPFLWLFHTQNSRDIFSPFFLEPIPPNIDIVLSLSFLHYFFLQFFPLSSPLPTLPPFPPKVKKNPKMFSVPTLLPFVLLISGLVCMSSVLTFEITRLNAKDSISDISLALSERIIGTTYGDIMDGFIMEIVDHLHGMKYGVEIGHYNGTSCQHPKIQNAIEYKNHTKFASWDVYMDDATRRGCLVDMEGNSVVDLNTDSTITIYKMLDKNTGKYNDSDPFLFHFAMDILNRPYYVIIRDNPHTIEKNVPIWSDVFVSLNPNLVSPGLQVSLTWPLLNGDGSLRGGVMVSSNLRDIDLNQYKISPESVLALMDPEHTLIASTQHSQPFAESEPKVYTRYTLATSGDGLLHYLGTEVFPMPVAEWDVKGHQEIGYGGGHWVQMRQLRHENLNWILVMAVPRSHFFARIEDSNKTTRLIVIGLVAGAVVASIALAMMFIYPIRKVAVAFDEIASMNTDSLYIEHVPETSILKEVGSLYQGFWQSVRMLKKVKTFLPQEVSSDEDSTDRPETSSVSQTASKRSRGGTIASASSVVSAKNMRGGVSLGLGVKIFPGAVCCVLDIADFPQVVVKDRVHAQKAFGTFFSAVHGVATAHAGRVSVVQGGKIAFSWLSNAKDNAIHFSFAVSQGTLKGSTGFKNVTIGVHGCKSFSGILGDSAHRHSVLGVDLLDGASSMASLARHLGFPVVVSNQLLAQLPYVEAFLVATKVRVHYTELNHGASYTTNIKTVEEGEWMYQLERINTEARAEVQHLANFHKAKDSGLLSEAREALAQFKKCLPSKDAVNWAKALSVFEAECAAVSTVGSPDVTPL